ncbi:MAG: O-antigen ligase family protein [Prevotella sp.]|nr:O-antigen ligase family protein [Prevotella sp.]
MMVAATSYSIYRHYGSDGMLRDIAVCSIISSLVLCYVLQTQYFVDYDLMDRVFAFNAKNSMGQILLNCAIVIVLFPISRIMLFRFVQWFTIVPIVVMLFMLKSRSTLVGFFFVVFYMILQSRDKRIRWLTLAVVLAFIIYLLSNAEAFNTIVYGILMAGRDVNDVNEVSSERIQTISEALEIIPDNILFGVGNKYVDCMPISMMLQFGFIGFVIVITYIGILFRKIVKLDLKNNIHLATFLIFVAMVLNSLFEAWPPFGPGVKCFMLWMMLGFSLALESKPNRQGIAKPLYE